MQGNSRIGRSLRASLLALATLAPVAAIAGDDARELLRRMSETMRSGTYEGTLVYQRGDDIDIMSLIHAKLDGREHERLSTLSGEPFELIRDGNELICVWPAANRSQVARRPPELLPSGPPSDLDELPSTYTAEVAGRGRTAGREARIVRIRPADRMRYGYRLWIDREQHLLLRSDLIDPDGEVVERILFTDLATPERIARGRFRPEIDEGEYAEHYNAGPGDGTVDEPEWVAAGMPAGFRAVSHRLRTMAPGEEPVQHSVYSDGLASVSVFVESVAAGSGGFEGVSYMGAVHAYALRVGDHQVTVIGEVPAETVRRIAESIGRAGPG